MDYNIYLKNAFETCKNASYCVEAKLTKQNLAILVIANAIFALIAFETTVVSMPFVVVAVNVQAAVIISALVISRLFPKPIPVSINILIDRMKTELADIYIPDCLYNKAKLYFNIILDSKEFSGERVIGNTLCDDDFQAEMNDCLKSLNIIDKSKTDNSKNFYGWVLALKRIDKKTGLFVFDYNTIKLSEESLGNSGIMKETKNVNFKALDFAAQEIYPGRDFEKFPITFD
jgi:hypothetical protein